jgi:4-hydroxymandelate oxidase
MLKDSESKMKGDPVNSGKPTPEFINLLEIQSLAEDKLTKNAFDYYVSGADDEITLHDNHAAFERITLYYHVLVDVHERKLETQVLGYPVQLPIIISPTAFHKMACKEGEVATARAASIMGTIMILSSLSNTDVEEVVKASDNPIFFQLYVYKDRGATKELVRRAEAAGCKAIVLTVDAPYLGRRERDVKNRFALPQGLYVKNLLPKGYGAVEKQGAESGLATYFAELLDQSLSWKDVAWLKSITKLPVVIKGIVRVDDALHARDSGADVVFVSNHGGRQLDTSPATIDALPMITEALNGSIEVWMDGGVRRGTDVLKALAYGANVVSIGRPILWGLALNGEQGAVAVLKTFKRELDLAMALAGCKDIKSITRDLISEHRKK